MDDLSSLFVGAFILTILIYIGCITYVNHMRTSFFKYIKKRNYQLVKNISIRFKDIPRRNTSGYAFSTADIIFLNKEIFLLPHNKPIMHISQSSEIVPGAQDKYKLSYFSIQQNILEIKATRNTFNITFTLNFENKDFALLSVDRNL
ncbi:hypothetical protein SAMN05421786_101995 [Chryseobacterium ureilyticum]|uniref:Uncharacterized protein n=2 Tax=Chryseobacterium ureilyticum TaxID=373668 RepID=A0A1N7L475_9FLAO|nr:hypothetical protein SAMN05421786_101995 [Chryseobacterium ureilyticum]